MANIYSKDPIRMQIDAYVHDARTIRRTFEIARYADGVDLSDLGWKIKIRNADGDTQIYVPESVSVSADKITFDWVISGVALAVEGTTVYQIDGTWEGYDGKQMEWQSGYGEINVKPSLNAETTPEEDEALSSIQKLIIYVNGELNHVIASGEAARTAADSATIAAGKALTSAESALGAAQTANTAAKTVTDSAAVLKKAADDAVKSANDAAATARTAASSANKYGSYAESVGKKLESGTVVANVLKNDPDFVRLIKGKDGVSPTIRVEESGGGHTVIVTDADGEHRFFVKDGSREELTADAIEAALGYVPANKEDVPEEISDDEVDAILDKLGDEDVSIPKLIRKINRKLELIETITFDGSTVAVYRNQTPSGKAYDFDEVRLVARSDSYVMHAGVLNLNGDKLYGTGRTTVGFSSNRDSKYVRMDYSAENDHFDAVSRAYLDSVYADSYVTDNVVHVDDIHAIEWQAGGITPTAGATLEIWGRWR